MKTLSNDLLLTEINSIQASLADPSVPDDTLKAEWTYGYLEGCLCVLLYFLLDGDWKEAEEEAETMAHSVLSHKHQRMKNNPASDIVTIYSIAHIALDEFPDTVGELLDLSDNELDRLYDILDKFLNPEQEN